jgi:hypothetical protein
MRQQYAAANTGEVHALAALQGQGRNPAFLIAIRDAAVIADKPGMFSATFFLACLAAMELEGVVLEEI